MRWPPAFVAATEAGRYAILRRLLRWAPFFFLFSRVSGPQVLNHKTRELIYQHIQQRPGSNYRAILKDLGLAHGTLSHHLYTLERANLIKSQRHGIKVRFFPQGLGAIRTRPLNPWQLQVMEIVRGAPGISQIDLARRLGVTKQALHYHVDQLKRAALVAVNLAGRETKLSLAPGAWARVGRCSACGSAFEAQLGAMQLRCAVCHAELTPLKTT